MCGIAGWLVTRSTDLHREHAHQLGLSLQHRGPDDAGVFFDDAAGLALIHQRLSILDLSDAGHQPMVHAHSGDVLIYNGEIYNHRVLREELRRLGHEFSSHCDTEVLLQALHHWGLDALRRVHGMYAFAWWQADSATLHLVRDPMGIKPLYYWPDPVRGGVVFASEAKALLGFPGFKSCIDEQSLQQYLEFGYTFDRDRTMFSGLRKLPPGSRLEIAAMSGTRQNNTRPIGSVVNTYTPDLNARPGSDYVAVQNELHETLDEVVAEHLIADVPVALLLSGGLDSSLLAAYACRHTKLHTLTFSFSGSTVDEREHARIVSRFLGTEHEEVLVSTDDFLSGLDDSVHWFDDLFADWGVYSTQLLYRQCAQRGIKAVIVGEGADELFGGYDATFSLASAHTPVAPLNRARNALLDVQLFKLYRRYAGRRYGHLFGAFRTQMRSFLTVTHGDLFAAVRLFESTCQLPNNYVMKVDKASMAASVEARVPFLDTRVGAIAYTLPRPMLIDAKRNKRILRDIASRHALLPESTIHRGKFGASIAANWMDDDRAFRDHAAAVILAPDGWTDRLGLRRAMIAYFRDGKSGFRFPHGISIFRNLAWRLMLLNLWARHYRLTP